MGGGHGAALHVVQEGEDGNGQGRPLCRVRTRAQLVKKPEGPGIGFI